MVTQLWHHPPFQEAFWTLLEEAPPLVLQPEFTAQGRAEHLIVIIYLSAFPIETVILGVSQYLVLGRHKGEVQEMFTE